MVKNSGKDPPAPACQGPPGCVNRCNPVSCILVCILHPEYRIQDPGGTIWMVHWASKPGYHLHLPANCGFWTQQPAACSLQPAAGSQQPAASSRKPAARSQQPEASTQQPEASSQKPAARSQQPEANSRKPAARSQQPKASSQAAARARGRRQGRSL